MSHLEVWHVDKFCCKAAHAAAPPHLHEHGIDGKPPGARTGQGTDEGDSTDGPAPYPAESSKGGGSGSWGKTPFDQQTPKSSPTPPLLSCHGGKAKPKIFQEVCDQEAPKSLQHPPTQTIPQGSLSVRGSTRLLLRNQAPQPDSATMLRNQVDLQGLLREDVN